MAKRGRKEKDNWKKKRRQEYLEKKEFRYYIFCEGQATEPKYFHLNEKLNSSCGLSQ